MDFNFGLVEASAQSVAASKDDSSSDSTGKGNSMVAYQKSQKENRAKETSGKSSTKRKKRKMANVLKDNTDVMTSIKPDLDKKPVDPYIEEQPDQDVESLLQQKEFSTCSSKKSDSLCTSERQWNSNDDQQSPRQNGDEKKLVSGTRHSYSVEMKDGLLEFDSFGPLNTDPETEENRLAREQWEKEEAERVAAEKKDREEVEQTNDLRTITSENVENDKIVNKKETSTESKQNEKSINNIALNVPEVDEKDDLKHIKGEHKRSRRRVNKYTSEQYLTVSGHLVSGVLRGKEEEEEIKLPEIITIRARECSGVDLESDRQLQIELQMLEGDQSSDVNLFLKTLVPVMGVVLSGAILVYFILSYI